MIEGCLWTEPELDPGIDAGLDNFPLSRPPFSHPASPMTIKEWVFVAIVEGKLEMGMGLG